MVHLFRIFRDACCWFTMAIEGLVPKLQQAVHLGKLTILRGPSIVRFADKHLQIHSPQVWTENKLASSAPSNMFTPRLHNHIIEAGFTVAV